VEIVHPGRGQWPLFHHLLTTTTVKGNLIPDAWFAALAIDAGCVWITTDRDFARFPGLRWMHPLDDASPTENTARTSRPGLPGG